MGVMLYRAGKTESIWGFNVDLLVVEADDVLSAAKDGWVSSPELTVKKSDSSDDSKLSVEDAKAYLDENGIDYDGLHWKKVVAMATEHMAA